MERSIGYVVKCGSKYIAYKHHQSRPSRLVMVSRMAKAKVFDPNDRDELAAARQLGFDVVAVQVQTTTQQRVSLYVQPSECESPSMRKRPSNQLLAKLQAVSDAIGSSVVVEVADRNCVNCGMEYNGNLSFCPRCNCGKY